MAVAGRTTGRRRIHARRACRRHDSLPYRNRAAADGLSEIAPLCEDGRSKKSLCPVLGHRQEKQAGEGEFEGKALSHRQQRCDSRDETEWRPQAVPVATQEATGIDSRDATGWRPQAVPVATQEATGIDSRDATGWRPQAVPVSEKDASRDHRQRGGALKVSTVGDTGPTDIAGRMRCSLSSSKAGCPGRYALRGRPARWAKPMRAWVSLAAVKSA